jgi:signal peptidase I
VSASAAEPNAENRGSNTEPLKAAGALPPVPRHTVLRWRLLAALCSAIVPGVGQWMLHQRVRAVVYWILVVGALALWWPLRLPMTFWGWMLAILATVVLWLVSAGEALLGLRRSSSRPSLGWLALALPVAFVVSLFICGWMLRAAGFRAYEIPSSGMAPVIEPGDSIIADVRDVTPGAGKVVIVEHDDVLLVKRVIGMPGNVVSGKDGNIFVNGVRLNEPYVQHIGPRMPNLENFGPFDVPQGEIFVLGDNRDLSLDSRMRDFGNPSVEEIRGRPLYIAKSHNPVRMGNAIH